MNCRHCSAALRLPLIDLGRAPLSNGYLTAETVKRPEKWLPLRVLVCEECWLVQTEDFGDPIAPFDADYAYFSGFSSSWLAHSERYVTDMIDRFRLTETSHVVEVAANDGYLLQYVKRAGIPCTGIEPTASTAAAARAKGISVVEEFFGTPLAKRLATEGKQADLITANNVLAHVPDISDFVRGFAILLAPGGVATFEFPHVVKLVAGNQFDTIYHEHYSYLSLTTVERIFDVNGLAIFDVEEHSTHGGSLRVFAQRKDTGSRSRTKKVDDLLGCESRAGVTTPEFYSGFQAKAEMIRNELVSFLVDARRREKRLGAYGAAAKGNTLMNFAGIGTDLIPFVVDQNPVKQGKFMPGSHIPIVAEEHLKQAKPDYVIILPWNIRSELQKQISYIASWGGKFVTAVPALEVWQ